MRKVEIDALSGFCGGVIRAIGTAEEFLDRSGGRHLFSLGDIVHNEAELNRLSAKGLVTIDREDISQMRDAAGETLLIRAHGEPPSTYERARDLGFHIVDCTCPVVLRIQKSIREAYAGIRQSGGVGSIIIYGKIGHAEVLGLVGQTGGDAVVVENLQQLQNLIGTGRLVLEGTVEVFSQTTMSPAGYDKVCAYLESILPLGSTLNVHDTICTQVAHRHRQLAGFSQSHDVVVFVSGRTSSNGRVLCELCKSVNIRTYHVSSLQDIRREWFRESDSIGICGATSTPKWLLEQVASYIQNLQ